MTAKLCGRFSALAFVLATGVGPAPASNYAALPDPVVIPEVVPSPKRGMTVEDEIRIRQIKTAQLSPDGSQVLVLVNQPDAEANAFRSSWFIVPAKPGSRARFLSHAGDIHLIQNQGGTRVGEVVGREAAWSPDGRTVAVGRQEHGQLQVWLIPAAGGEARQLTRNAADVMEFVWTPDGKSILYTVGRDRAALAEAKRREGSTGYLFDSRIRPDYASDIEWPLCMKKRFSTVEPKLACEATTWIVDVASGTERPARGEEAASFAKLRQPDLIKRLAEAESVQFVTPSPDGKRLAWAENVDPNVYTGVLAPMVITASARADMKESVRCPREECVGWIHGLWWNPVSREVVFQKVEGHQESIRAFYAWKPGSGVVRRLLASDASFMDCKAAGDRIVCVRSDWTQPAQLVSVSMRDGKLQTLFDPNPEFANFAFTPIEKMEWVDANGNDAMGHFVYPADYEKGKRYPLVVVSYGFWGYMKTTGDEHAVFAMPQQGFAVLFYSIPFTRDTKKLGDMTKITAAQWATSRAQPLYWALDELDRRGLIDTSRVGISGLSNGATMVDEAIAQTKRFAAASAGYSNSHPVSYYLLPAHTREASRIVIGGEALTPDALAYRKRRSPGMSAATVSTPLLLNVADRETMSAVANYVSLVDAGKPVEMLIYPDERHVKWQPAHKYAVYRRNLQWFQFWLQDTEVANPVDPEQYVRWRKLRELRDRETG
jgi:dipeptidyl aminopeptidase/acylaminoacyl peptidase